MSLKSTETATVNIIIMHVSILILYAALLVLPMASSTIYPVVYMDHYEFTCMVSKMLSAKTNLAICSSSLPIGVSSCQVLANPVTATAIIYTQVYNQLQFAVTFYLNM